jgi:hypothetical protein
LGQLNFRELVDNSINIRNFVKNRIKMNYEEAEKLSLKVRWKTSLCVSGEGCWCRTIETEQELRDDEGLEVGSIAESGCISKKHAEYIVNLHNKSLDA